MANELELSSPKIPLRFICPSNPRPSRSRVQEEPPADPMLTLARQILRRWDIALECSGEQRWIETTASNKKVWLILETGEGVTFEPLD